MKKKLSYEPHGIPNSNAYFSINTDQKTKINHFYNLSKLVLPKKYQNVIFVLVVRL